MLNSAYCPLREGIYQYHRLGLDVMSENIELGDRPSTTARELPAQYREKPGCSPCSLMMDAKRD
jgi:hypothetical protein